MKEKAAIRRDLICKRFVPDSISDQRFIQKCRIHNLINFYLHFIFILWTDPMVEKRRHWWNRIYLRTLTTSLNFLVIHFYSKGNPQMKLNQDRKWKESLEVHAVTRLLMMNCKLTQKKTWKRRQKVKREDSCI